MGYIENIRAYMPKNEQETQDKQIILECLCLFPDTILLRDAELAHITSSGFILNRSLDKTLMAHHNIRDTWAWTGGHADGEMDLLAVAMREAAEETGVCVRPIAEDIASLDVLTVQGHQKNGKYVNSHLHLSVAYVFTADEDEPIRVKPDENSGVAWFPVDQICEPLFSARDVYLYTKLLRRAEAWVKNGGVHGSV